MIENDIKNNYKKLKKEYAILSKKYSKKLQLKKIRNMSLKIKNTVERDHLSISTALFFLPVGLFGLFWFKKTLILELGLIVFIADLIWEMRGTEKGMWKYKKSKIFMIKKVPIEIPLMVFSLGLAGATLVLFLLEIF